MIHRTLMRERLDYATDPGKSLARRRACAAYLQTGPTFNGRQRGPRGERAVQRAWRVRRCPMTLDDEDIEQIARRVAELIGSAHAHPGPRYVDAGDLARMLGIERDWVYAHARELGAIRLGGPRGRLRFDVGRVADALSRPDAAAGPARRAASRRRGPRAPRTEVIEYER
jgi:hypothetical protein